VDCQKLKQVCFVSTIDCDHCSNEDVTSTTVFVITCLDRDIIDGRHNCVKLFWLVTVLGLLLSFKISHSLWRSYIHMQAGLTYSVQQLGCRLEIWGLVNRFLEGAWDFFFFVKASRLVVEPPIIVDARGASAGSTVAGHKAYHSVSSAGVKEE